jgi:hypothetical protein
MSPEQHNQFISSLFCFEAARSSKYLVSIKNCLDKDDTDSWMEMQMRTQLSLVSSGMLMSCRKREATDSSASAGHSVNQSEMAIASATIQ